ncbi:hypothetical protein [Rhizobium phage RHph_X3_9]|nr:hypothetical protein [Rhizobium phage RHph_X3_9]
MTVHAKIVTGDQGGVCGHSTNDFWQEWDLYVLKETADWNMKHTLGYMMIDWGIGKKPMVFRNMPMDAPSEIGTVWMIAKADRTRFWNTIRERGLEAWADTIFEDRLYTLGMPINLGGGRFTTEMRLHHWTDDANDPGTPLGYLHQCGGDHTWEHSFIFNDYTQEKHWFLSDKRDPNKKPVRSLGQPFKPSAGARYGDSVR